jgi:amino acid transporter/mannitol/fructose-specific phosphotransferase system IIA component (Ntr-type)/nucleotide-binding universal stress UspA family protein
LKTLERRLGLGAVVAISISAMLGSGIFVLPGLAAAKTGPMVWLAYLVAGLTVLPAALSKSELATAMPSSGGTYVYLERTFGPLTGTISGIGLWLSMLLKSAFALVGFGAYLAVLDIAILDNVSEKVMALTLLVAITILNIVGVSIISKMQKFIIAIVLVTLLLLAVFGLKSMELSHLDAGFTHKGKVGLDYWIHGFLAATAFVYVAFAGVTKVAAIAEEVKDPDRNLPRGILISWIIVLSIYVLIVFVLVTNVPMKDLTDADGEGNPDLRPIFTLATIVGGKTAGFVAAVLAVVTMVSMAVAGLLAASRFPFAMSRDQLLPESIKSVNPIFKTPVTSILLTAFVMMMTILFLPVPEIAKLASAFMILAFMLVCGTVIVLRESASQWYKPGFRSPLYPTMQILGIISGIVLLYAMGPTSLIAIGCIVGIGAISYFGYGKRKTSRQGVLKKMGKRQDLVNPAHAESLEQGLPSEAAVVVPLFGSERSPETLVEMGASLAHGRKLEVLHLSVVPEQISLADALEDDPHTEALSRRIHTMAEVEGVQLEYDKAVTRDVVDTIHKVATRLDCEWVVMESAGRRNFGITFQNPLGWLQDHLACNLAVFKDAGVRYIRQILVFAEPGPHDSLVVMTADHLANIYNAELNFICFKADGQDPLSTQARADYVDQLRDLCTSPTKAIVIEGSSELDAIQNASGGYDLMIMGAAPNRTLTARFLGTAKDNLTRNAECSVLWLKTPATQTHDAFDVEHMPVEQEFDLLSFVDEQCVMLNVDVTKKEQLFRKATDLLAVHYPDISPLVITSALWEREQLQNTAVGNGLAIPHATLTQASSSDSAIAIMTTAAPIDYDSPSKEKMDVFFFTTGSPNNRQTHVKILAEISKLCLKTNFLDRARNATSNTEVITAFRECLLKSHGPSK